MAEHPTTAQAGAPRVPRYLFAGLCASLVGIGLARFSFMPLIPELIAQHWFSATDVMYLGTANLLGYLGGALLGRPVAARLGGPRSLRWMMVAITAALLAGAFPLSFGWYFGWRLVSGVAGGVLIVLVAATILPHIPPARKGLASGAIFLGLGLGIAGSGTVIPPLLRLGLMPAWVGLAAICALLTAASWRCWPPEDRDAPAAAPQAVAAAPGRLPAAFYAQYALMAFAGVAPMMFLVDFIARGLHAGTGLGLVYWTWYGVGAVAGPPLYGWLADKLRPARAAHLLVLVQIAALVGLRVLDDRLLLGLATVTIGSFAPGIVPLALAWVQESLPGDPPSQHRAWSKATISSAAATAVAGYADSALFQFSGGDHRLLFLLAAGTLLAALLIAAQARRRNSTACPPR